jgi:hypothetical protein
MNSEVRMALGFSILDCYTCHSWEASRNRSVLHPVRSYGCIMHSNIISESSES